MKKLVSILTVFVLACLAFAVAAAETDLSAMTNEELVSIINNARNELVARNAKDDNKAFLVNTDEYQVYLTGKCYIDGKFLKIEAVFVNNSDRELSMGTDAFTLNGWEVNPGIIGKTSPHSKKKADFDMLKESVEVSQVSDIETLMFKMSAFDSAAFESIPLGTVNVVYDGTNFVVVSE